MAMTLSDTWDRDFPQDEALEVYADCVQAIAREFEARRARRADHQLLERLRRQRDDLERRLTA